MYIPSELPKPDNTRAPRGAGNPKKSIKLWLSDDTLDYLDAWADELNMEPAVIGRWLLTIGMSRLEEVMTEKSALAAQAS